MSTFFFVCCLYGIFENIFYIDKDVCWLCILWIDLQHSTLAINWKTGINQMSFTLKLRWYNTYEKTYLTVLL